MAEAVIFICAFLLVYFVPSIVAAWRNHPNIAPIVVLNLFLGWTLIFWVAALVWALTAFTPSPATPQRSGQRA